MSVDFQHDVTIFFYNPNIHPREEYEVRKEENKRFAEHLGIPFVDADYDSDEWYRRAKGMEFCPERGTRCSMCFDMRFERTAVYAVEHGFSHFATTNATSRWKDAAQVNASGARSAARYEGKVTYWAYDGHSEGLTRRKYEINAQHRFYKQEYCGCSYSLRDVNAYRATQGEPAVRVPSAGVFDDPERDAAEESPEVVASFFDFDSSEARTRERELREVYRQRRKDGRRGREVDNNW